MHGESLPVQSALESKELKQAQFDTTIVFGQGPIRQIKLVDELTEKEKKIWRKFKASPRQEEEPDFFALNKEELTPARRLELQNMGKYAMRRMGKLNALAAGHALVTGQTKEVILSGGRTIGANLKNKYKEKMLEADPAAKDLSSEELDRKLDRYLRYMVKWPSEAELQEDLIVRRYSHEYKRKFGKDIREVIKKEDRATNTIENLVLTINRYPEILQEKVALLSSGHHLRRILLLANWFALNSKEEDEISAQASLEGRALGRGKRKYIDLLRTQLPELPNLIRGEVRWTKGLEKPEYIAYWLGYTGKISDPNVLQKVLKKVSNQSWNEAAKKAFEKVGIDFDEFSKRDLLELSKEDPELYDEFRSKLTRLTLPENRIIPPAE